MTPFVRLPEAIEDGPEQHDDHVYCYWEALSHQREREWDDDLDVVAAEWEREQ